MAVSKRTITIQWIKLYALGKITESELRKHNPSIDNGLMDKLRTKYKQPK